MKLKKLCNNRLISDNEVIRIRNLNSSLIYEGCFGIIPTNLVNSKIFLITADKSGHVVIYVHSEDV